MPIHLSSLRTASVLAALAVSLSPSAHCSAWTSIPLPNLPGDYASTESANLPDGRFVYGSTNSLALQSSFGASTRFSYILAKSWDPSSIAIQSSTLGAIGAGTINPSSIYTFNPSSNESAFTAIPGLSIQNYNLVFRDGMSIYVDGIKGSQPTGSSISYVTLDGATNKVIIDNVSTYSGGFAIDPSGNLYVTDDDNQALYKFTKAQLDSAVAGSTPLTLANGTFLTTLQTDVSIAVDSEGRIWSAGYQIDGIDMFNPANGTNTSFIPALDNDNYIVSTFSQGGNGYVGFLNESGPTAGSSVTYGYAEVTTLIPEPSIAFLLALGLGGAALRRQR